MNSAGNNGLHPRIVGFIPARGGSKSIPHKNLQLLGGVPLIVHTIRAAIESGVLERVILNTDDEEIAAAAREWGCETPFMRPANLASDESHVMEVTLHAIRWFEENEQYYPEYFMLLQPTSPFRSAQDIRAAARTARLNDADAVVSVMEVKHHPYWTKSIDRQGRLHKFIDSKLADSRRQGLTSVYCLNGAIYLVRRRVLLLKHTWCPDGAYAHVMPASRSLDIDDADDLAMARVLFNHKAKISGEPAHKWTPIQPDATAVGGFLTG